MSEKKNPAPGDEVYDIHGRAATYVARTSTGHIVEPIHEHEDYDEPIYGSPETWKDVFSSPPTGKLHAEVAEVEAKLNAARKELYAIQAQRHDEDRAYAARVKERERFAQLKTLDDYIAGKITHFFVVEGYGERMSIQTADQFLKANSERDWDRSLRLVSLFGDSKGNLSWCVDRYSDGSGGSHGRCFAATSYEEALGHASKWLETRYAEMRKEEHKHRCSDLASAARKLNLPVPDDIAEWARQTDAAIRARNLEDARKQLANAQKRVDDLESA
ncbi:hypothetical protein [Caballeronia sp. ATUFL_M1_KS5A]|uniref:hypothetical protein n=1 Tax=Caballeronia sp. ATUFL_M1_KS5A TaxID=2921778 RepID=UPI002028307B|nr:hypothetical protein [Caballeronia sp. ATUFL_M1_KS5A]